MSELTKEEYQKILETLISQNPNKTRDDFDHSLMEYVPSPSDLQKQIDELKKRVKQLEEKKQ